MPVRIFQLLIIVMSAGLLLIACGGEKAETESSSTVTHDKTEEVSDDAKTEKDLSKAQLDDMSEFDYIMPLDSGNSWTYQLYVWNTESNRMMPMRVDSFYISGDTAVMGTKWAVLKGFYPGGSWFTNRDNGLWFAQPEGRMYLFAHMPARVGMADTTMLKQFRIVTKTVATDSVVTVMAGSFVCNKYVQEVGTLPGITNYWMSPGVGMCKVEVMDSTGTRPVVKYELMGMNFR